VFEWKDLREPNLWRRSGSLHAASRRGSVPFGMDGHRAVPQWCRTGLHPASLHSSRAVLRRSAVELRRDSNLQLPDTPRDGKPASSLIPRRRRKAPTSCQGGRRGFEPLLPLQPFQRVGRAAGRRAQRCVFPSTAGRTTLKALPSVRLHALQFFQVGWSSLRRQARGSIWIAGTVLALGCSSPPVAGYQPSADAGASDVAAADASSDAPPEAGAAGCTPQSCGGGLVCDTATRFCRGCASDAECAALGSIDSACVAGLCSVPCATNADCASDPFGSVCDGGGCRACLNDAECTIGAGICLDARGGLCARSDQAVFV
jgi:hypothetical protein